jgi:hypothetical protein
MPTTPAYELPYPAPTDPADVPADLQKLAAQVALVLGGALSATPPANPIDGQLWAFPAAAGTVWLFRYNPASGSAYKWEFVGGPPWESPMGGGGATAAYGDIGSLSPFTVPRNGDYVVAFGASAYVSVGTASINIALKRGAAATADSDGFRFQPATANLVIGGGYMEKVWTACVANDVYKVQAKLSTGACSIETVTFKALPVRVS